MAQDLYVLEAGGFYKIGVAVNPHARVAAFQCGCPHKIKVVGWTEVEGAPARDHERYMHWLLGHRRVNGEWFSATVDEISWAGKVAHCRFNYPKIFERWVRRFGSPAASVPAEVPVSALPVLKTGQEPPTLLPEKSGAKFDRLAYQREYMRKRRARENESK